MITGEENKLNYPPTYCSLFPLRQCAQRRCWNTTLPLHQFTPETWHLQKHDLKIVCDKINQPCATWIYSWFHSAHWQMFTDVTREVHYNRSYHVTDVKPRPTTPVTLHLSITALPSVSWETPAGQECEDWRISLSRRYSEPVPFCLTSFTGQHFCKCDNKNCIRRLHFNTSVPWGPVGGEQSRSQRREKEKENLNIFPLRSKLSSRPQKSPEVNFHQSWDFNKLPPACDTVSTNLIWTQPL